MRPAASELERLERPAELSRGSDPVAAWLGLFGALSGLSHRERAEVAEELSDHLRERVRELMVRGLDEHDAVRAAIEELGGAAEMAARFRSVTVNSRRRLAMNLSMLGLAGTAAVLSLVAVVQPRLGGGASVYAPPTAQVEGPMAKVIDIDFVSVPLAEIVRYIGEASGVRVSVHWGDLESRGVGKTTELTIDAQRVSVAAALALIAEAAGNGVDFRASATSLEIGTREYFDRRETTLASYDLAPAQEQGAEAGEIIRVVQSLVESDGWRDNGGDLATAYVLGGRLFVEAPPRFHDKIRWILQELAAGERPEAGPNGPRGEGARRYPLANTDATELADRLRGMIGSPEGVQVVADPASNSLVLAGDPEAVEAGLVSGLDVVKSAETDGAEPVILVIEYDGKRRALSVDRARLMTRAELLSEEAGAGAFLRLNYILHKDPPLIELKPELSPSWLRDLPLVNSPTQ